MHTLLHTDMAMSGSIHEGITTACNQLNHSNDWLSGHEKHSTASVDTSNNKVYQHGFESGFVNGNCSGLRQIWQSLSMTTLG